MVEACDVILADLDSAPGAVAGARVRTSAHADDRPHARRACRAHDLRPQAGALVRRADARCRARPARPGDRSRRQDFRRGRDLRASRSVDRSGRLPAAGSRAGADLVAGHSARSARRTADRAGDHGRVAREVRARDSRPAEDRDRRGRRTVRQGPEGLVGDAAQAQPDRLRADRRARPPDPRQRDGGARERRPVARARHLAFVGRARDPARQLHRARSHAAPFHAHRRGHGRVSGSHAGEPRTIARRDLLGAGAAGARAPRRLARTGV